MKFSAEERLQSSEYEASQKLSHSPTSQERCCLEGISHEEKETQGDSTSKQRIASIPICVNPEVVALGIAETKLYAATAVPYLRRPPGSHCCF
jgi:hypothetical protein